MIKLLTKIQLLFLAFLCFPSFLQAQATDTTVVKDTIGVFKNSFYVRSMPLGVYTGAGFAGDKITQNIEFGKSFGVIDIGLAVGRTSLRPDTTNYLQMRVTMDACQYGIFSNELAIGAGYVFNSSTPLMLELSSTIFAQLGENWGLGLIAGVTDQSGIYNDNSRNFYGLFFRYGLMRNENGALIGSHKSHRARGHHAKHGK